MQVIKLFLNVNIFYVHVFRRLLVDVGNFKYPNRYIDFQQKIFDILTIDITSIL